MLCMLVPHVPLMKARVLLLPLIGDEKLCDGLSDAPCGMTCVFCLVQQLGWHTAMHVIEKVHILFRIAIHISWFVVYDVCLDFGNVKWFRGDD